jgi:hypothetical protein
MIKTGMGTPSSYNSAYLISFSRSEWMDVLLGQIAGGESGRRNFNGHSARCRREAFQAYIALSRLLRTGVPAKGQIEGWN